MPTAPGMTALVLCVALGTPDDDPTPAAVVAFAREHLGTRVGNGQCTSLVVEAYREAGARRPTREDEGSEVRWGEPVASFSDVRPGDVLTFRDAVFQGRYRERRGLQIVVMRRTRRFPDHAAIVDEVREGGKVLVVIHQNAGSNDEERKTVRRDTLRMGELRKGGVVKAFRPVGGDQRRTGF